MTDEKTAAKKTAPKGKSPEQQAAWRAMRHNVLPKHFVKPVNELEQVVGKLEPLLKPRAGNGASFVESVARPTGNEAKRAEFEDIIAKADAMCRYLRMEQTNNNKIYDQPTLQPMLDTLYDTVSIGDELKSRGLSPDNFRATTVRMEKIDRLRRVIRDAADAFGAKVNVDTLWNAYRMDFRGQNQKPLSIEELEQNPFIKTMEQTAERLRQIAQAKAMEKLARNLESEEVGDVVIAEKVKGFLAKLRPNHVLKTADFARLFDTLLYPTDSNGEHHHARMQMATRLRSEAGRELAYYRGEEGNATLHTLVLKAYHADAQAYLKPQQLTLFESMQHTDKELASVMESAPHLRNQLNYLRAEAALRHIDTVLEHRWRAVSDMYPTTQQRGWGQGA